MAAPTHSSRKGLLTTRRAWAILCAVAIAVLALAAVDRNLRDAPHAGFVPAGADWAIQTENFPGVWRGFEASAFHETLTNKVASPLAPAVLELRQRSGMRLTPGRWRVWLGDSLTVASKDGVRSAVFHPGLLARIAEPVASRLLGWTEDNGIVDVGEGSYAWRDGFLIVSETPEGVRACLNESAVAAKPESGVARIRWKGGGDKPYEVALDMTERLPIEIVIKDTPARRDGLLSIPAGPVESELLRVQGGDIEVLWELGRDLVALLPGGGEAERQFEALARRLPATSEEFAAVLTGLEVEETRLVVTPEVFVATRGAPSQAAAPEDSIPFLWDGREGWLLPWAGEPFTLCGLDDGEWSYFASSRRAMGSNLSWAAETGTLDCDAYIYVDWEALAERGAEALRQAADYELLPRMNRQDAEGELVPYLDALAELGESRLYGRVEGGRLVLRGDLRSGAGEESEL